MKIGNSGSRRVGRSHQVVPDVPRNKPLFSPSIRDTHFASIGIELEFPSIDATSTTSSDILIALPPMDALFNGNDTLPGASSAEVRKQCRFNNVISIGETWSSREYERGSLAPAPLTPLLAYLIRIELNEVKAQMDVHQDSRHYTQFFPT